MLFSILFILAFFFVDSSLQQNALNYIKVCDHDYKQQIVSAINEKRELHQSTPPLVLDESNDDLVTYTQQKAQFQVMWATFPGIPMPAVPVPSINFTQLDLTLTYTLSTPASLINELYSRGAEGYQYFETEPTEEARLRYEDFTQMIWASTQQVTLGCADGPFNQRFLVAAFLPPGNVVGQFASNVRRPKV